MGSATQSNPERRFISRLVNICFPVQYMLPSVNFLLYFVLAGATGRTPDPFSEPRAPTSFSARGRRLSEEQRVLTPPPLPPTLRARARSVVDRNISQSVVLEF